MTLDEAITQALLPMEAALDMFGKRVDADMVRAWRVALTARGVTDPGLIERTMGWFLAHATDFPKPAEFADRAIRLMEETHVAIGVPCDDGETLRIELVPIGGGMSEPRRIEGWVSPPPLPPVRELHPAMDEAATDEERRRQMRALGGEE